MSRLVDQTGLRAADGKTGPAATNAGAAPPAAEHGLAPTLTPEQDSAPVPSEAPPSAPGLRERARIRRRVRFLRQLRELQLRDLGGFLVEQLRLGRENPAVVQTKLEEAAQTDRELRALDRTLGEGAGVREVRVAGIGGACAECGTVHGSTDRYCSWCGRKL